MKVNVNNALVTFLLFTFLPAFYFAQSKSNDTIFLKGTWFFQIDRDDIGIQQKWYQKKLIESVKLPGAMRDNNKGDEPDLSTRWTGSIYDSSWYFRPEMAKYRQKGNIKFPFWLTPNKHYVGVAWYKKEVDIPSEWNGRKIELYLERPHWETTVWIDNSKIGMQNSLSTPHRYDLTNVLKPGHHIITIRVDNRIKEINVGPDSHSITDQTQGNWNGIIGNLCLIAKSPIYFEDIKLFPDIANKLVSVKIILNNISGKNVNAKINITAKSFNSSIIQSVEPLVRNLILKSFIQWVRMFYCGMNSILLFTR